ncbi:MAG: hypothetical protein KatS3mg027_1653 [Bacteroidia bacterium]|nr:MAG: hypothetical protein KatS3mg027_1653 [Bacteroidia bacterium]
MKKNPFILYMFLFISVNIIAQKNQGIGQWKDLLGFYSCNSITYSSDWTKIYVSNRNSIAVYNTTTFEIENIYNKTNGLSDVDIQIIRNNPYNNKVLICYENGNIDVLDNNSIINISDIKNANIIASKKINEVTFKNHLAYLACGFGISVLDMNKLEIKETYFIGKNNSYINVYQVAFDDSLIYAATDSSVFRCSLNTLLNDFRNWKKFNSNQIPNGTYSGIVNFNGKVYAAYSPYTRNNANFMKDTLYVRDNTGTWTKTFLNTSPNSGTIIKKMYTFNNACIAFIGPYGANAIDKNNNQIFALGNYSFGNQNIKDIAINYYNNFPSGQPVISYIADEFHGFLRTYWDAFPIPIDGARHKLVSRIKAYNGKILIAPSKIDETGGPHFYREGISFYDGEKWNYLRDFNNDTIVDITDAMIDPDDETHIYATSWINGLVEYKNNKLSKVYNSANSGLVNISSLGLSWHRYGGLVMDPNKNIWISHAVPNSPMSVLKSNGQVVNFFNSTFNTSINLTSNILFDKNNQVWMIIPGGKGILVYKHNNFEPMSSSNTKFLSNVKGNGNLPSNYVWSIAEDKNGYIWIGTSQGVAVIYNPENVFNGGNYDAQQIFITQDGQTQLLLATEKVTAITIDGADRKWIGTESSGLFCFSPDGQTQIYHFTTDNSPIASNNIIDIAYDEKTGDIIIGTDKGIQSYRTDIIGGFENYTNVHAFPNPVKRSNDNIYIKGLIDGSIVKITDIAGNLVWEGKSTGGMITWNLQNLYNQKVNEGIYIVYTSTPDAQQKAVAKIMVVN